MEIILFLCSQDFSSVTSLPLPLGGGALSPWPRALQVADPIDMRRWGGVNLRSPAEPQLSQVVGLH